jgi:hypothetical protein
VLNGSLSEADMAKNVLDALFSGLQKNGLNVPGF